MARSKTTVKIWTSTECIVLLFVGSAAEFALVEEADWLFYTNSLPSNPQRRFIETFRYNQKIILVPEDKLPVLGEQIRKIHTALESKREKEEGGHPRISNAAFKAVGSMIVDYCIKGYEYLHHTKLTDQEKEEYYQDIKLFMQWMSITDLEPDYKTFIKNRVEGFKATLKVTKYTQLLLDSYKKDVGPIRWWLVKQFMAYFVYPEILEMVNIKKNILFYPIYKFYPYLRNPFLLDLIEFLIVKKETKKILDDMEAAYPYQY